MYVSISNGLRAIICEDPICVSSCPCGAIYKEAKYGAVLIDNEKVQWVSDLLWTVAHMGGLDLRVMR